MEHFHHKTVSRYFNKNLILCDQLNYPKDWIVKNSAGIRINRCRVIVTYWKRSNTKGDEYIQSQKIYKNIRSSL